MEHSRRQDSPKDRPGAGAALAAGLAGAAGRRDRRRDLRPLARLVPFVAAHRGDAICALIALFCSATATLGLTEAARLVVDRGFAAGSMETIDRYFVVLVGAALFLAAASASRYYFVSKLGERVVADIRQALYAHVLTLDQAVFLRLRTGEVLSRLTTDTVIVESMVGAQASAALRNLLMLIGSVVMLTVFSPRLTLFVLMTGLLVLAPLFLFGRKVRRRSVEAQDRIADAIGFAGESLDGLETVQAFGQERTASGRFHAAIEAAFDAARARIRARAGMTFLVIGLAFSGVVAVLWAGAQSVVAGTMTGGTLVQFVFLAVLAASALGALGEVWGEVQKASGAMERIDELLRTQPAIAAPALARPMPFPAQGAVLFEDVVFAYPGRDDLPSLRGFSLNVRPGERVALVGPSGAGKSTVLRLLLRFYDPQQGAVRIDGVDLREVDPAEARARIALVGQEAPLFSGSALENLRFGRTDATDDELRAAARAAQAEAFLSALPHGFDTPVGERGKSLSGGQRQRLAIARALVRRAPVLLLDEATSALDAESERLVQRALDDAMEGRTTLVVAHRLATILRADRIVVMDEGRVVEEGRHDELVARGGLYARLAALQFGSVSGDHRLAGADAAGNDG
jgi:ATP-binding cassette subfamily B protein